MTKNSIHVITELREKLKTKLNKFAFGSLISLTLACVTFAAAASSARPTLGWPGDARSSTTPVIPLPGKALPQAREPGVPFPLSTTLPFPWGNIEGVWKVEADNVNVYFSFSVQTDTDGHQYLRVLQFDSVTGVIAAEGVGLSVEDDKLVRAAMNSKKSKIAYMLFIGSYKNTNSYVVSGQSTSAVTVLTVRPFSNLAGDKDVQVVVSKVSNDPFTAPSSSLQGK